MRSLWKSGGTERQEPASDSTIASRLRFVHREMVILAGLVIVAVVLFTVTRYAAHVHRAVRLHDASKWYAQAVRYSQEGRTEAATAALRRATVLNPENTEFHVSLARALIAGGDAAYARQVLLRLRLRQAENPGVNLELARLEAQAGDVAAAVRYYQHALAGLWSDRQNDVRSRVRLELTEFLLRNGQRSRALSELLVVAPALSAHSERARLGRLFLQAGDSERALEHFVAALRTNPHDRNALAGAGEAAFAQGQYVRARAFLMRAPLSLERVAELRAIVDLILSRDPLASRLSATERRRRLAANVSAVADTVATCGLRADAGRFDSHLTALTELAARLRRRSALTREEVEDGVATIDRAEAAMGNSCGPHTPFDRAMRLIARRHDLGAS